MTTRNPSNRCLPAFAISLTCAAGLAVSAAAQDTREKDTKDQNRQRQVQPDQRQTQRDAGNQPGNQANNRGNNQAEVYLFKRVSTLLGESIVSRDGTEVATVDDLIVDRGTGQVTHVITISNTILGFGGDRVAVPYEKFRLDMGERRLSLDLTDEQIETFGESPPADYIRIESGDLDSSLQRIKQASQKKNAGRAVAWQPMMTEDASTMDISGTVVSIERERSQGDDMVVLGVQDEAGAVRKIVTGPSWYVMDPDHQIRRGAEIDATVVALGTDGSYGFAAREIETDGDSVTLWNDDWQPEWQRTDSAADRTGLITATELVDMDARSNDDSAGEIEDGIIELSTGTIAMLLLDPNDNLFGIGDDLKCVPWNVTSVGMERVNIDSTSEDLKTCENVPDDLTMISSTEQLRPMYQAFDMPVQNFERRDGSGRGDTSPQRDTDRERDNDRNRDGRGG